MDKMAATPTYPGVTASVKSSGPITKDCNRREFMMLGAITPVILTFNESPNIKRSLAALEWADDIVVVDSGSTDGTLDLLRQYPKVRLFRRPFDTHAKQWRYALTETKILTPWIL